MNTEHYQSLEPNGPFVLLDVIPDSLPEDDQWNLYIYRLEIAHNI